MANSNRLDHRNRKVEGREHRAERKKRQNEIRAYDGRANGVVEIPGPLGSDVHEEILRLARRIEAREKPNREGARILGVVPFKRGIAIETEEEKLAQMIADGIARSRNARIERVYDDEGARRILTCTLPDSEESA